MLRLRLVGSVRVALAPADAFALFTPSGERRWAAGWDPWFPVVAEDETAPGTVFTTDHEDVAYLRLDYAEVGVQANIHVSWLSPDKVRRITAVGSKKMAVYDDLAADERIRIYDKSAMPPEGGDGPLSRVAYHLGGVVSPFIAFAWLRCCNVAFRPHRMGGGRIFSAKERQAV